MKLIKCPQCNGNGELLSTTFHNGDNKCEWCKGEGEVQILGLIKEHPEDFCNDCKNPNPVWSAPNELWNKLCDRGEIICPVCFQKNPFQLSASPQRFL